MTRQEFVDNVTTAYDLVDFCYENDLDLCASWITSGELDDRICEIINDMTRDETWDRIRDYLNGIEDGYEYYDADDDFRAIDDDDVENIRDQILGFFEFDDGEDEDAEFEEDETDYANYAAVPPAAPEVQQLDSGGMNVQDLLSAFG